ncbi:MULTISPECIES: hypothetical protein [unclassified Streptomyces]|uniref:hypothetical protein n=1 Tax=unclassified Streptomyces TaxID=2593676 RepID=UPI001867A99D|nr:MULTISPECIES: hypothetical protein [unclassified Streptomyces]
MPERTAPTRGPADPVKVLLHRHRDLCERAVDPLEIAAGLEARGLTDRTAARFRHRDVFSLAEELYARVPRGDDRPRPVRARERDTAPPPARWFPATLLPGAAACLTTAAQTYTTGPVRPAVTAAGLLALAVAVGASLRHGPLRAPGRTPFALTAWTVLLLAYAAYGDGLLDQLVRGGLHAPWPPATGPLLGLALAVPAAAACTRLFAVRAGQRLAASRGLDDFAARARPLLLAVVALQLAAVTGLALLAGLVPGTVPGALAPTVALGVLLFTARLLAVHGYGGAAAAGLGAACAAEALACASLLVARLPLPGFDVLDRPVRMAVATWGTGTVPAAACGVAALALLAHATAVLARASAHARP